MPPHALKEYYSKGIEYEELVASIADEVLESTDGGEVDAEELGYVVQRHTWYDDEAWLVFKAFIGDTPRILADWDDAYEMLYDDVADEVNDRITESYRRPRRKNR